MSIDSKQSLLTVSGLHLGIRNTKTLVHDVSFSLEAGKCFALVGESGCGKTLTAMSIAGLLPSAISLQKGSIQFSQYQLQNFSESQWRSVRGNDIGVIFQNPLTAFNPVMRIGDQIAEVLVRHKALTWKNARIEAIALLDRMGVNSPENRARQFPFEFSGGMLQRAMIAMAVACKPRLLIADEPTTALDVTIQAQVLKLLRELQVEQQMAILLITHDLAVVAQMAQEIGVMYAGRLVETGMTKQVLSDPQHPYTKALKSALPVFSETENYSSEYIPLKTLAGTPLDPSRNVSGCALAPRCEYAMQICEKNLPDWIGNITQKNRCWLSHDIVKNHGASS